MTSEQASVAELILQVQELEHELTTLRQGLETRTLIGQATGLLAGSLHLSLTRAWQVLRLTSSYSNIKMRDVARVLVHAHDGQTSPDDEALAVLVVPALERAAERYARARATGEPVENVDVPPDQELDDPGLQGVSVR